MSKWDVEKENLQKLVDDKVTYVEMGRIYGCSDTNIRKVLKNLGIKVEVRNPRKNRGSTLKDIACPVCGNLFKPLSNGNGTRRKTCSADCGHKHRGLKKYEKYTKDNSLWYGKKTIRIFKRYFLEEQNNQCDICGIDNVWNGKELTFVLDHIDGNADENSRENLRLICSNCDSQLDTYKSKNKNSARAKHRKTLNVAEFKEFQTLKEMHLI